MNVKIRKKRIVDKPEISDSREVTEMEDKFLRKGLIVICSVIIAICNYYHVSYMQENHVMFSHLSTLEREMSFRTEMGFYYSFFKQVVEAPSLSASIHRLTSDNLTEYPRTLNALHRFNVYPELFVGFAYRAYISICKYYNIETRICYTVNRDKLPPVHSCEGFGEPAIFYVNFVMLLNGIMLPFLFLISYYISGRSIVGGLLSTLFYFYNHRECTRVQWTPPLRESFSYPFLIIQQFFLLKLFVYSRPSKIYEAYKYGYLIMTLLALLSWQFAQFALLIQCIAVFLAYIVAGDPSSRSTTQRILWLLLAADLINVVLQFGNTLLLVGPLRPCIITALFLVTMEPAQFRSRFTNNVLAPLRWLLLTATLLLSTITIKYAFGCLLQIHSDDHMFDILKSKFTNFKSFDSLLYTCAAEFDFYNVSSLLELCYTGLLPISGTVIATIVLHSLVKYCRLYRNCVSRTTTDTDHGHNFLLDPGLYDMGTYFLLFQTIAFTVMAAMIMRLKLFWTPQLCVLAAFICHRRGPLVELGRWVSARLALTSRVGCVWPVVVVVVALCSVTGLRNVKEEWSIRGSYSNWDQEQLLGAVMAMSGIHDSFVGQMATMATVRLVTGRAVTVHPHYEDERLRDRVHIAYALFSRKSVHQVWLMLRSELHASHLVYEQAYCALRAASPGCSYAEMWDLVDPANARNPSLCSLINDHIAAARLGRGSVNDIGRYFKWKFTSDGGAYTLFELVPLP